MEKGRIRTISIILLFILLGAILVLIGLNGDFWSNLTGQVIGNSDCSIPEECENYFIVCQEDSLKYNTEWKQTDCNPSNCGKDLYSGCEKKETYWTNYYREICISGDESYTECSSSPKCEKGKEIKRIEC